MKTFAEWRAFWSQLSPDDALMARMMAPDAAAYAWQVDTFGRWVRHDIEQHESGQWTAHMWAAVLEPFTIGGLTYWKSTQGETVGRTWASLSQAKADIDACLVRNGWVLATAVVPSPEEES